MKNEIKNIGFRLGRKSKYVAAMVRDGFRDRLTVIKSWGAVPGVSLFVMSLLLFVAVTFGKTAGIVMAMGLPLKVKIKTDGLAGEELVFMNKLQNLFYDIDLPEGFTQEKAEALYTAKIKEALEPYMKLKEISMEKIKELLDDKDGVMAILLKQGAEITKLKNEGGPERAKTVREQVEMWVTTNKDSIEAIRGKKDGTNEPISRKQLELPEIKIKAPITMQESASMGGSVFLPNVQVLPGVIDLIRKKPTFWDRLLKPATKANPLVWVNKYNKQGSAAFTSEGATKSQASFELKTESSNPVKTTEYMKISTEMLNDIDYLAGVIQDELRYEVDMASNAGVLTGTGVAPNPKGVTLYGAAYALPGLSGVIAPNNADAIVAAVTMLRSLNFNGQLTAFLNPIDKAQMDLAKALTGVYVNSNGVPIDAEIVSDNNIAVGYLLVGDMSKYHIQMYQDFYVQWGFVNDDFIKNLVTVIGERRFHQWVSINETAAFVYDQFATIRAAIS